MSGDWLEPAPAGGYEQPVAAHLAPLVGLEDILQSETVKSRQASAASLSTSAVAVAPRAPWTASPGRSRVFDGMHVQYEH